MTRTVFALFDRHGWRKCLWIGWSNPGRLRSLAFETGSTLVLILGLSSSVTQAQSADQSVDAPSSQELINRMSDATKKLTYEGEFIFTRGNNMDVMRVLHKSDSNGEHEKITSLTGPAREIIRNNQTVTGIFPDTQEVMIEQSRVQSFPANLPERMEAIADYYQYSTKGTERIAGRDTWVVSVDPKDDFRYGYQLWIDKDTYLLLKSELRDESGVPLEVIMFTQLQMRDSLPDELFAPSITGEEYTRYEYTEQGETGADLSGNNTGQWQVTWLPDGFRLSNHKEKTTSVAGDFLEHMIYSDGVSMVSIFIEKLGAGAPNIMGSQKIGGVNVYARSSGGYQITAVGEVPQATVMRMVDSVVAGQ